MSTQTIILLSTEWILVVFISGVFIMTTILHARNNIPLEVNYEKRLGEFHCDPSMLWKTTEKQTYHRLQGAAHMALQSMKVHSGVDDV